MDEKKVREAIELIRMEINTLEGIENCGRVIEARKKKHIALYNITIEALEKQLPKKAIIKAEKEVPQTHNLGRLLRFHCPNCGKFIVAIYESDTERGGGISNSLKGCSTCLQAIDFSDYYSKRNVDSDKLNEELQWDD